MSVQQSIVKGIKELLFRHNYLVLPGFGGFVLKSGASHFSASGLSLDPPFKTLSFNARLKQNDSLLALWLQEQLQCSAAEAMVHLTDFSEYCLAILNTRRRLTLDGIDFFYLDFENNVSFEPQPDVNFLTESFGLGSVQLKRLQSIDSDVKEQSVFQDRSIVVPERREVVRSRRSYQRVLVPVALLAVLFSLLVLFVSNSKFNGQFRASLFGSESRGVYEPIVYPDLMVSVPAKEDNAYVANSNGIAGLELEEKTIAVKALEVVSSGASKSRRSRYRKALSAGSYEIVLGCFAVPGNADKMADKLSRLSLEVRVSERNEKGMYVVSTGSFVTKEAAVSGLMGLKGDYPRAWIR